MVHKYKALVVDDSKDVCLLAKVALENVGFKCDLANNGVSASALTRLHTYDLLITDLRMPEQHGHDLIVNLLKENYPATIIAISGLKDLRIITDLLYRGVEDVMQKPIDYEILAIKALALLKRKKKSASENFKSTKYDVEEQIESASNMMQKELASITNRFEKSIRDLKNQSKSLESGYVGSLRVLINLMGELGVSGENHSTRVEEISAAIGNSLNLDKQSLINIRVASLLHEVGQFGMPDKIKYTAPWLLNGNDLEAYQKSPLIGATLLSEIEGADCIVDLVAMHMECFDGSGFPYGLKGENILQGARVIRIADGIDTFIMHCNEEDKLSAVKQHLYDSSGSLYQSSLVKIAINYLNESSKHINQIEFIDIMGHALQVGDKIVDNVYDEHGRLLARNNCTLTQSMAPLLQKLVKEQSIRIYKRAEY